MSFGWSVIIAELWQPEVTRHGNLFRNFFRVFFEKRPLTVKLSKFCSESFHRVTDRRCVQISWNVADGKTAKSCVIYQTKNSLPFKLSNSRYCSDRAKSLPAPDNVFRVLQISSKSVHFQRSYSRTRESRQIARKVNPIFDPSLATSRIVKLGYLQRRTTDCITHTGKIFSGRELAFTFRFMLSQIRLSSVCLWRWCTLLRRLNFSAIFFTIR